MATLTLLLWTPSIREISGCFTGIYLLLFSINPQNIIVFITILNATIVKARLQFFYIVIRAVSYTHLNRFPVHQGSSGTFPDFPQYMAVKGVIVNPVLGAVVLSKGIVGLAGVNPLGTPEGSERIQWYSEL